MRRKTILFLSLYLNEGFNEERLKSCFAIPILVEFFLPLLFLPLIKFSLLFLSLALIQASTEESMFLVV